MNTFGRYLRIAIVGESHGPGIGLVLDGVPPGIPVDEDAIQARMDERRPGQSVLTTQRSESDQVRFQSGVYEGHTTGAPVLLWIGNDDTRSKDYSALRRTPRPGHSDWVADVWARGFQDHRGGGHYSGRLTAALVAGAALITPMLAEAGVAVGAHLHSVGDIEGSTDPDVAAMRAVDNLVNSAHPEHELMADAIDEARNSGDSLGGIVAWQAEGVPVAWGDPFFDSIESRLAHMFFAVPAVKGVDFGAGFDAAAMKGSEHNDAYAIEGDEVVTKSNHSGGILGGRTTGMPLHGRVAIKPTSSIFHAQDTVDLETMEAAKLELKGRHDPCIAIRAVPVIRAAAELVLADFLLQARMEGHQ